MSSKAIATNTISIPRSALRPDAVWAAIDYGCSLIKVVLVDKEEAVREVSADSMVPVHTFLYQRSQEDEALQVIKERVHIPSPEAVLHTCGVGFNYLRPVIKRKLGIDAVFIDEFISHIYGLYCCLTNASNEVDVLYPQPQKRIETSFDSIPLMLKKRKYLQNKLTRNDHEDGLLPAIFIVVGSGTLPCIMSKEKKVSSLGAQLVCGLSFLGLAQLILDTSDYDEIAALADKGHIGNTHLQVKDILPEETEYGHYPRDMCTVPFGKVAWKGGEGCSREDKAAALVSMFAHIIHTQALQACEETGISRVYLCGNWINHECMRRAMCEQWSFYYPDVIKYKFVKAGYAGALGTMLLRPDQVDAMMESYEE